MSKVNWESEIKQSVIMEYEKAIFYLKLFDLLAYYIYKEHNYQTNHPTNIALEQIKLTLNAKKGYATESLLSWGVISEQVREEAQKIVIKNFLENKACYSNGYLSTFCDSLFTSDPPELKKFVTQQISKIKREYVEELINSKDPLKVKQGTEVRDILDQIVKLREKATALLLTSPKEFERNYGKKLNDEVGDV